MERLWSPWRLEYVAGEKKSGECVFCLPPDALPAPGTHRRPDPDSLILFHGATAYVILNLYPYNNGHLMVVPYRHLASLTELQPDELFEVARLVQRSERVLTEAYSPGGINVGINLGKPAGAGIHEHLHVHLVPRWYGDSNFMTVIGRTRVLPEELHVTAARLRPIYERMAETGSRL